MTGYVIAMIVIGFIVIIASFFISEKFANTETKVSVAAIDENYEFSEQERNIIKNKIEDVIAEHAKDILYETNESLASMANEKTMALGDYAVAVCDEIEKNHKEVMFLYSMLEDKQKEIMQTVKSVDDVKQETKKEQKNTPAKQEKKNNKPSNVKEKNTEAKQAKEVKKAVEEKKMADKEETTKKENAAKENQESALDEDKNQAILDLHKEGVPVVDIAKQLGLGVGEVKLVIDLYQGE